MFTVIPMNVPSLILVVSVVPKVLNRISIVAKTAETWRENDSSTVSSTTDVEELARVVFMTLHPLVVPASSEAISDAEENGVVEAAAPRDSRDNRIRPSVVLFHLRPAITVLVLLVRIHINPLRRPVLLNSYKRSKQLNSYRCSKQFRNQTRLERRNPRNSGSTVSVVLK